MNPRPAQLAHASDLPALSGLRVTELCQYIAGPGTAMILHDLGAEVVKVEPLNGEAARHIGLSGEAMIRAYNRGKRSVAVDLHDEQGVAVVERLIVRSDIFVHNLRPGALERLGLTPERIRELNPRIIDLAITGYGPNGPSSGHVGYDIAAQAESGMMSVTGAADGEPQRVGFAVVDAAAAHIAAQAALAALVRRGRTGVGSKIEVSLLDVALQLQANLWDHYLWTGIEPVRRGNGQAQVAPAADVLETADGHIVVSAYKQEHWLRLCAAVGRPELVGDERFATNEARVANRPALLQALADCLSTSTSDDIVQLLARHDIVSGTVRGYEQANRNSDVELSAVFGAPPEGAPPAYRPMLMPYALDGTSHGDSSPPPRPGEHTDAILAELGLSTAAPTARSA